MAYQAKRLERLTETLELVDSSGNVIHSIDVNIDLEEIAREFNTGRNAIIKAQIELNKAQQDNNGDKINEALEACGNAVIAIFNTVFGKENTSVIIGFYENNYTEMFTQIYPFITDVVAPAINKAVEERKNLLRNNHKSKQKRKFGK